MMSAATSCPTSGTVSSAISRPMASAAVHPDRCCAARFPDGTAPGGSVVITARPVAASGSAGSIHGRSVASAMT
jgi:hypothetical protein